MSLGDRSDYPLKYDTFINLLDEVLAGTQVNNEPQIVPSGTLQITLNHMAKKDTLSIPGFVQVDVAPNEGEYQLTNAFIPTAYQSYTGITYSIGNILLFHSTAGNRTVNVSYKSPGDVITADLINTLIDSIYKIEKILGLFGSGKDLDIGNYNNIASFLVWLRKYIRNHNHQGLSGANAGTPQLDERSFESLSFDNSHIKTNAQIEPTKLKMGIIDFDYESINTGVNEITITNNNVTSDSVIILQRYYATAGGDADFGTLMVDPLDGEFTVLFDTPNSRTETVYFYWFLIKTE